MIRATLPSFHFRVSQSPVAAVSQSVVFNLARRRPAAPSGKAARQQTQSEPTLVNHAEAQVRAMNHTRSRMAVRRFLEERTSVIAAIVIVVLIALLVKVNL